MRIGQLAKKYQIAHSSIYYYMKLGLLIPMAEDKFYEFDDQCQKDLETIIKFKEMNFSLEEISAILSLQRLSPLADPEYVDSINRLLGKKFYELHHEIKVLEQVIQQISAERARLITDARLTAVRQTGMPFGLLDYLRCPCCGGLLEMQSTAMNCKYIFSSKLACPCGYRGQIRDGILIQEEKGFLPPPGGVHYYQLLELPPESVNLLHNSHLWMNKCLQNIAGGNKVILETDIGAAFFLHRYLQNLAIDNFYIICDSSVEKLFYFKELADRQDQELKILFIQSDGRKLPLKRGSIDIYIDSLTWNEHMSLAQRDIFAEITPFTHEDSLILGTFYHIPGRDYSGYHKLSDQMSLSGRDFRQAFNLAAFKDSLLRAGWQGEQEQQASVNAFYHGNTGDQRAADNIRLLSYLARRGQ